LGNTPTLENDENKELSTPARHLTYKIDSAQQRAQRLKHVLEANSTSDMESTQLFQELTTALEELRVADEELQQQNDALLQTRQDLENERQRYHDLFEYAPDAYLVTDMYGIIREVNRAAETMLNIKSKFLVHKPLTVYVPPRFSRAFRLYLAQLPDIAEPHDWEVKLQPRHQPPIDVSISVAIARDRQGIPQHLRWQIRDVTRRNQTLEALRLSEEQNRHHNLDLTKLSQRLLEVQESEKRLIARELHDEIGQSLTALKIMLSSHDESGLTSALGIVDDLIVQVRSLSLELRPTILDDLGLIPALLWYFNRYTTQTNIKVRFKHQGIQDRFAHNFETAVFRIVQEALTNVARYAEVNQVSVRLLLEDNILTLEITDKGKGFDKEQMLSTNLSAGITGMIERAALLGGHLDIKSAPGRGCQIRATLPLEREINDGQHSTGGRSPSSSAGYPITP
jgi:PAS domain S-box-containing protein